MTPPSLPLRLRCPLRLSSRTAGVAVRQQTQSVSLRLIPPVALSFALTATINAFISRPPLVLQRLTPRTQLSNQPSKSSTSFTAATTTSCPSSSFLIPHLHQMRCLLCRSQAAVLLPSGHHFLSNRQSVEVFPNQIVAAFAPHVAQNLFFFFLKTGSSFNTESWTQKLGAKSMCYPGRHFSQIKVLTSAVAPNCPTSSLRRLVALWDVTNISSESRLICHFLLPAVGELFPNFFYIPIPARSCFPPAWLPDITSPAVPT